MKNTKGPWFVQIKMSGPVATIENHKEEVIAICDCETISVEQNVDNALLIAAAPDLLEIVQLMAYGAITYEDPRVLQAIKKAKGE